MQPGDAPRTLGVTVIATAPNGLSASRELSVVVAAPPADGAASAQPAPPSSSSDAAAPLPDGSDGAGASLAPDASSDAPMLQPARKGGSKRGGKLDGGAIAGIVIGVLVATALAALAALKWRRRTVRVAAERHVSLVEF